MTIAQDRKCVVEKFASHATHGISYRIGGSGPALVLLRGLARWSEHWCGFDSRLASDFRVITIDNRGFGGSRDAHLDWTATIGDFAQDVLRVLDDASIDQAHLVGVSLGGMIAVSLSAKAPSRIKSIMLVNSSVAGSPYPRITPRAILALSGALYRQERVHDDLAQVLLSATAAQELRQQFAKAWRTIDVATGVPLANIAKQLMAAKRFRAADETKAIVAPVSIIKCLGDNFVDPRCSDWIHKLIPAAAVIEHPTAGHELAYEDPAWFCQQIKNYTLAILA